MKKGLFLLSLIVTFYALGTVSASAVTNDTVKVGLRYGSSVMSSANLENDEGSGYEFGYFEDDRTFVSLGETDETAITMEPAGRDGIQVTITGTDRVLYESREDTLAVMPQGRDPVTWFRGNRYRGGFEYTVSGGGLQVVNVVDLEDYVKGVLPSEMPGNWELEALKAQAVCARTFACLTTKHLSAYGFDVCSSTDCQVYNGVGEATSATDRAVEETEGECLYYDGELAEAYYHSSDGGATEDAENVWGTDVPYLRGKEDPYEAQTSIPDYSWTVTYTWDELTWVLQNSGYDIGDVVDAYVSEVHRSGQRVFRDLCGQPGKDPGPHGGRRPDGLLQHHPGQERPQPAVHHHRRHRRRQRLRGEQRLRHPCSDSGRRVRHLRQRHRQPPGGGGPRRHLRPPARRTSPAAAPAAGAPPPGTASPSPAPETATTWA